MPQGTVQWFGDAKSLGFIAREGGPDVFVHSSAIEAGGFCSFAAGDVVKFESIEGLKGAQAANVRTSG
jgi:CspA family cold shock protein